MSSTTSTSTATSLSLSKQIQCLLSFQYITTTKPNNNRQYYCATKKVIFVFMILLLILLFLIINELYMDNKLVTMSTSSQNTASSITTISNTWNYTDIMYQRQQLQQQQTQQQQTQQHHTQQQDSSSSSLSKMDSLRQLLLNEQQKEQNNNNEMIDAIQFVLNRYDIYEQLNLTRTWKMRGIGYLYWYWNMILVASIIPNINEEGHDYNNTTIIHINEPHVIRITNVLSEYYYNHDGTHHHPYNKGGKRTDDNDDRHNNNFCSLWTFYVRINGPEIFAGTAHAVITASTSNEINIDPYYNCYWEFPFKITIPGEYIIDSKLLYYNGTSVMTSDCIYYEGKLNVSNNDEISTILLKQQQDEATNTSLFTQSSNDNNNYYYHSGFRGFKMYTPIEMCCEICSRMLDCIYWATPPYHLLEPTFTNTGCELFYIDNTSEWIPYSQYITVPTMTTNNSENNNSSAHMSRMLSTESYHGPPVLPDRRPTYFLGCGWSFWMTLEYPCLDGDIDDRIYINSHHKTFMAVSSNNNNNNEIIIQKRNVFDDGKSNKDDVANDDIDHNDSIHENDNAVPLCSIESELPENHYGRWVRESWPNTSICSDMMIEDNKFNGRFPLIQSNPNEPKCWFRENLNIIGNNCVEMNCKFILPNSIWKASLIHLEQQHYSFYKQYQCQYQYYTNIELQQCINERRIVNITGSGRSIWDFLRQYLYQRLEHIQFYNNSSNDDNDDDNGIIVHLSTLKMLHFGTRIFKQSLIDDVIDKPLNKKNNHTVEYYWINGIYTSSEREQEARGPVLMLKTNISRETLLHNTNNTTLYHLLNFYDITAAFTYDTATQFDGLHIIGPPMKMLITKLFHYMCYNTSVSKAKMKRY